ncbi:MAG: PEPxxWA-CTERM sorting domain-containing protein [Pseudomonadota bacterium]
MTLTDIPKPLPPTVPKPKPTPKPTPQEVPEPATYALMLGGLALVGLARRRRQSAV